VTASDQQQQKLGRQQFDDECTARRAAVKTQTTDVTAMGYPPSDEGHQIRSILLNNRNPTTGKAVGMKKARLCQCASHLVNIA